MIIRKLCRDDYNKKYIELLHQLSATIDNISQENFNIFFDKLRSEVYVIEDVSKNKIIASGSIFIEPKFIHNLSYVGHIEDIVIDKDYRGKGYGKEIVNFLINIGRNSGCYKVILNCNEDKVKFYENTSMIKKDVCMAIYFNK